VDQPLGSRYVLHELLGRGAMGQVFRGTVRGSDAAVAVKVLKPELVSDTEVVARFFRERSILTSIDDPNVAKVLDLVVEGDTLGIVMELVEGQDLRRYLRARGTLPPGEAVYLVGQLFQGLAAVHAGGIVHRDVKPENVLVGTARGQMVLKLTDFGVSRLSYGASLTKMTSLIGTPEYMAPELADHDTATPAADLYSAGIVLYEMLAGRTPFAGGHPLAVLRRQVEQPPPPIPGAPAELWAQIGSLLAKDPRSRPASAVAALGRLAPLQHRLDRLPALPPMPDQPAPMPGQTLPPWESGQTTMGRERGQTATGPGSGQTVLRARDRGQGPAGESGPPPVVPGRAGRGGRGRVRAQRRRAVLIALSAALVVVAAAAAGLLLTRSPHTASPAADPHIAATRDASLNGQPTSAPTATRSAASPSPATQATAQLTDPTVGSGPTQQANPPGGSAHTSSPQNSPASPSPVNTATSAALIDSPCGTSCIALYVPNYGDSDVLGVVGSGQNTGQSIDMQPVANVANQNWIAEYEGTVSQFFSSGLMSAGMDQNYGSDSAFQYQYTPYGVKSGLCLGVSGTAQNGTAVTLQQCNVNASTLWVTDTAAQNGIQVPLINGSNTDFTQPFVLTAKSTSASATTSSLGSTGNGQYWNTENWG
jgi:tRNA A-37 threonylcarbamoyl transferase component Bud32